MKFINIILTTLVLLYSLISCNEHGAGAEQGRGYLDLRVSCDVKVDVVPVVKSGSVSDVISVTLIPEGGGEHIYIADVSQLDEPLELTTGKYRIVASSGEDKGTAAFDSPHYYGESSVVVRNMQVATAEVVCTLTSVKVSATFSQAFVNSFDYKLVVSNGESSLEFSPSAGTIGKSAYFHVTDELSWQLDVENVKGENFSMTDRYTDIRPKQHYDLYFDVKETGADPFGAAEFVITVDNSFDVKEYDMPIYIYPDIPVVLGAENISIYSGDPVDDGLYHIVSTKGFDSVVISHSDNVLSSLGIPKSTELFGSSQKERLPYADAGVDLSFEDFNSNDTGTLTAETTDVYADFTQLINNLPIGNYSFTITAVNSLYVQTDFVVNISVNSPVEITSLVTWANFAVVKGRYFTQNPPAGFAIQHKTSGDWTDGYVLLQDINTSAKTFKTMVCKLSADTNYSFRLFTTKDGGLNNSKSVKTEANPTVANLNFNQWTTSRSVVYPYTGKNNGVWDTANEGTSTVGTNNITTEETSQVIKGSAVKMTSAVVMSKFAAGNIYTGDFDQVQVIGDGGAGAMLNWGIKFTGRPVAMKGYYKYSPVKINYADGSHGSMKGQMDKCQVQVALTDNSTCSKNDSRYYFYVDTPGGKFVDFSSANKTIIAHNKIETSETISSYRSFTLPFGYRKDKINTQPGFIIITCCSSYLGDYFTGGEGSTMWADEFELIYDPSDPALSDQQRRDFFNLF